MRMAGGSRLSAVLVLTVAVLTAGCASEQLVDVNRRLTSLAVVRKKPPDATYVVDPPDSIRVEFLNEPGLTRDVQLRSDGCVSLAHLEDVKVGGMTTVQIRRKLEELYTKYYKEPLILVTVTAYRSKHVYVYGEVGREGQVAYTGTQTVSDVIGSVGGVTRRAARGRVKVVRGDPDEPEVFKVDLNELILDGDTRQDVSLAENDVVYVPPTVLAWVGYQIDSLLFPFRSILSGVVTARAVSEGP